MQNIILIFDSYKSSHFLQYPKNMTYAHDYMKVVVKNKYGY